jgi:ArsR family transcriptional regulator, arsenate/arsenite/antimonite-responsive transcriptional repressor / arsenate reductase (thioredoxin)
MTAMAQPLTRRFALGVLANDLRWQLVQLLARSDRRVNELADDLREPQNLVSYHLAKLREATLVHEHRSSVDARDVYYSLDIDRFRTMLLASGEAVHPSLGSDDTAWSVVSSDVREHEMQEGVTPQKGRVLFLCTRNSARSQMAEGLMRHYAGDLVDVFSAGTETAYVHPDAITTMSSLGIDIGGHRSKHLKELVGQNFDYIITVCDRAKESCPIFPGDPVQIHWSFSDPAAVEGEEERARAFTLTAHELTARIRYLIALIEKERKNRVKATAG